MDQHAGDTVTRWLLCDYGNVLSSAQPPGEVAALAELCSLPVEDFDLRYWRDRMAYDRADLDAPRYWARVLGRPVEDPQLNALVDADVASWCHLNAATLAATRRAEARGYRLALLSNAPVEVARAVEQLEELAPFSPKWFSCDLRAAKPDVGVFEQVLTVLGGPADAVTFVDDRVDNVAGATSAGLRAVLFEDPSQIDDL
jgi:putative hydrolase of the HAD superfamily